ncbi:arabinogalactan endo-1,4-beta-galactosidase-like protein [Bimuria novae-zelandiae CBS 107.79]|uniref:Arabinogalactan endo-beta-1,4-galactanase n=1 Tax=Bimuria novae-zelandiae CBS 107.79 TaxID=1447943 RepID=A0A6A5UTD8_9PLEO|nr:arabinogalactan endo-1,4-beta-galactosidase-like protein [Bimuria novae-zelandiae CBS 107.79]
MRLPSLLALLFVGPSYAALAYKGVDWSSLLVEEKAGRTYKNTAGQTQPLETILKASGVNTVRQRIWVNPSNGDYNLDYNLKLAKRAKAAGLKIYLDFHYSDTWADPAHQGKPSAWSGLSTDALVTQVWKYTNDVLNSFASAGITLSLVSIGNEITPGLLFPTGQISSTNGPKNAARLLKAASNGVKESSMSPTPKIMIHLDNGWNKDTQTWWYDTVLNSGGGFWTTDFDVMGVSYYPFYNPSATLSSLSASLNAIASKWSKEVMVVETDWPTSCPQPAYAFPSDAKAIPFSAAGQMTWMKEVAKRVAAVPGGKGTGLFYWEPAWVGNAGLGSSCASNTMVDGSGKALSSLAVFGQI